MIDLYSYNLIVTSCELAPKDCNRIFVKKIHVTESWPYEELIEKSLILYHTHTTLYFLEYLISQKNPIFQACLI